MDFQQPLRAKRKLQAINYLFVFSALIGVLAAYEISRGAVLHKLNFMHVRYNNELSTQLHNFSPNTDLDRVRQTIVMVREQPLACLGLIGPVEEMAMRAAGTYGAARLCEVDIESADRAIGMIDAFRADEVSFDQLHRELIVAEIDFKRNSNEFSPLVERTVNFVFWAMMTFMTLKGLIVVYYGLRLSRGVSRNVQLLTETSSKSAKKAARYNDALRASTDAVWEFDLRANEMHISPYFFDMLSVQPPADLVPGPWLERHMHEDDLADLRAAWALHTEKGEPFDCVCRMRGNNEKWQWIRFRGDVERDDAGVPVRGFGTASEVTKLVEAKIVAELASESKSEFLATVSHEIRTPMNGVLGMLSALLKRDLGDDARHMAVVARDSAQDLLKILNEILDFSRMEAGQIELERLPVNVREMAGAVVSLFSQRAQDKGLSLSIEIAEDVPDVLVFDPTRVRQVLVNLVANAIKFTSEGSVKVRLIREEGDANQFKLRFDVADSGIGIPEEKRSRLFKPFSQIDSSTTRKFGGAGLGLAICAKLVESMGGLISCESKVGQGATFSFSFDVAVANDKDIATDLSAMSAEVALIVDQASRETTGTSIVPQKEYSGARQKLQSPSAKTDEHIADAVIVGEGVR